MSHLWRWMKEQAPPPHTLVIGMIPFLLIGCLGQDNFRRGEEQLAAKQWESAIDSFRQASREDVANLEYRAALVRATENASNALLNDAAALRDKQPAQAREIYRRVLLIAPNNDRASAGLAALETAERHQRLADDASRAASAGRDREARAKYKKLLDEVPQHAAARQALRTMDEKDGRSGTLPALDPALRKPVSLEFRDATLKMVFDALASSTGINFLFDRDLKQDARVTVFLRNVAFDDALDQIVSSNGLALRIVNSNTLLIYPSLPQKTREYQNLVVRNFFVANADVKQLANMLKTVLKVKDLYLDDKRNLIVIRDTPELVGMAEKLVAAHDQPEPEVMIEVEILEFNHTRDDVLGIKFPDQVNFGVANPITLNALRALNNTGVNVTAGIEANLPLSLTLNLKRQIGEVNLLANPRIRVRNREKAKFHIGDKVPVITSTTYPGTTTGATSSSVSYLDVGIKLEFEPSIQLDDDVVIKTSLEVSSITSEVKNAGTTAYQVGTRNASTTLTLRDGETQVLAGLMSTDESDTANRLPGLGDIPIIGRLFSNRSIRGGRKEILLSLTPRIVRNLQRPTEDLVSINFGPEAGGQGGGGQSGAAAQPRLPAPAPAPGPLFQSGTAIVPNLVPVAPFGGTVAPSLPPPVTTTQPPASSSAPVDFEPPPGVGSTSR